MMQHRRLRLAVHKFSSCDGCQLALLNLGEALPTLYERFEVVHFAEAGQLAPDAHVDVAIVEGSISVPEDTARIHAVREQSRYLITIGACATAGGLQALRNLVDADAWRAAVYPKAEQVAMLPESTPIRRHVRVDLELWGCPVTSRQVMQALASLALGAEPAVRSDKVCLECKRRQAVCTMVAHGLPCMGPVTATGCGAICPRFGRDCYGCFGPAESANTEALALRLAGLGLVPADIARRFAGINSQAPAFHAAHAEWVERA